mmetsp:Transcript_25162/g.39996  ORF Transcript_25162/g.39996 Transcript_25162/m.39996 type:complete len:200 (-) Transcript_25162:50-649(-)
MVFSNGCISSSSQCTPSSDCSSSRCVISNASSVIGCTRTTNSSGDFDHPKTTAFIRPFLRNHGVDFHRLHEPYLNCLVCQCTFWAPRDLTISPIPTTTATAMTNSNLIACNIHTRHPHVHHCYIYMTMSSIRIKSTSSSSTTCNHQSAKRAWWLYRCRQLASSNMQCLPLTMPYSRNPIRRRRLLRLQSVRKCQKCRNQ